MYLAVLLICQVFLSFASAFYENNKDITELNPSTFNSQVIESDEIWIVEFYAPWCGHCQALVSEYTKMASALKGLIKVGAVNADQYQPLGQKYEIRGFPTIKIFGTNKNRPRDYTGPRTAQGMVDEVFRELKNQVEAKLSGKKSSSKSDDRKSRKEGDPKDVIELTDSNFQETVLDSNEMWLVEFYAPWCGHCQRLAPHWAEAATELKGKVKLGALDATVHTIMARKYDIKGFPTIKYFPQGSKDGTAEEYDGGRTAQDIINWALEKHAEFTPPPEVVQVTDASVLKDACENHPLCVISILPHILDCQSACRNEYIDILKKVGNRYRKNLWGWVWAEALAQPQLEDALGIGGFGYPAMAVLNARKMKFSILRGPFSYDGISEFIRTVSVGRGSSSPIKGAKLPEILETEAWDGKDGELPVEEDIDLSDVDLPEDETTREKTEL
ncbi:protein disulfide-isomerase A6 homolog [Stegodyphus dumicola]|uniref:protein disulfide-isomerase A6 homolog n=1 Tax=Stegodyphus dumicola TaxID=202533 RepID=UPI0015A9222B|nr:protein disulfide-isomerase A6 homolog [Stegodyphus dumicola]